MPSTSPVPKGITLIELLTTVAIVAVIAGIALPAFASLGQDMASRSARSLVSVDLAQARAAAVMRASDVVACPSSNAETCSGGLHWHRGWIVFADANRNRQVDSGETLIAVAQALKPGLAVVSSAGRRSIRFRADGTSDGSNLTLTFCDRRGITQARALVLNNSGRLRSGTPNATQAAAACAAIDT